MTAREYLSEVQRIQAKIKQKEMELQTVRDMATHITASINPARVQNTSISDKVGECAAKAADLETEILEDMASAMVRRLEIVNQIQALDNPKYIELLYLRYIQLEPMGVVSAEMGYTYEYILDMHKKALKAFEKAHKEILEREGILK